MADVEQCFLHCYKDIEPSTRTTDVTSKQWDTSSCACADRWINTNHPLPAMSRI
jgi:hypothetical protein